MIRCHECDALIADEDLDTGVLTSHVDAGCPFCSATLVTMHVDELVSFPAVKAVLSREAQR